MTDHPTADEKLLEQLRAVNSHWCNPLVEQVCVRFYAMMKELDGYRAWERSVNEALNSGDGAYRP